MPTRNASAKWEGGMKGGKGTFNGEGGAISGQYNFGSRFENGTGSNPEELLAAAEAACFSMALSGSLERNGTPPTSVETEAACTVEKSGDGFSITRIKLDVWKLRCVRRPAPVGEAGVAVTARAITPVARPSGCPCFP